MCCLVKQAGRCCRLPPGEPLIASGREAVEVLRRNLLKTMGVWWLPPVILKASVLLLQPPCGSLDARPPTRSHLRNAILHDVRKTGDPWRGRRFAR